MPESKVHHAAKMWLARNTRIFRLRLSYCPTCGKEAFVCPSKYSRSKPIVEYRVHAGRSYYDIDVAVHDRHVSLALEVVNTSFCSDQKLWDLRQAGFEVHEISVDTLLSAMQLQKDNRAIGVTDALTIDVHGLSTSPCAHCVQRMQTEEETSVRLQKEKDHIQARYEAQRASEFRARLEIERNMQEDDRRRREKVRSDAYKLRKSQSPVSVPLHRNMKYKRLPMGSLVNTYLFKKVATEQLSPKQPVANVHNNLLRLLSTV
jgi:rRNA maturation protein Nop10